MLLQLKQLLIIENSFSKKSMLFFLYVLRLSVETANQSGRFF